jgi:hypothetical protein
MQQKKVPCRLDINFICYLLRRNLFYRVTYKLKRNNIFKEENFSIKTTLGMNLTGVSLRKTSVKYFDEKKGSPPRPAILLDSFSSVIVRKCQTCFLNEVKILLCSPIHNSLIITRVIIPLFTVECLGNTTPCCLLVTY